MSEFTGLHEPKALQRFLNLTQWDSDKLRDIVSGYVIEHFSDSRGVLIADPTGFAKKGRKSAGVQSSGSTQAPSAGSITARSAPSSLTRIPPETAS